MTRPEDLQRLDKLTEIGIALSAESNPVLLLERILDSARELARADGGTLYTVRDDKVTIQILHNDSLRIRQGGTAAEQPNLPEIPLFNMDGSPNLSNVVSRAVHENATVNVADCYAADKRFDFSGAHRFDRQSGYHSASFLTVPLRDHEHKIIGVLQLINALDPVTRQPVPFDPITQRLIEALASQAAITLTKEQLIKRLERLVDIGIALSSEGNPVRLLELILDSARALAHADAGTLYTVRDNTVSVQILRNESLGMELGGTAGDTSSLPTIPLYKEDGSPNLNNVVTCAIHQGATVNIEDSYSPYDEFDFSGTHRIDRQYGYRSVSFLTVPLRDHENEIVGALQLINALDPVSRCVVAFDAVTQRFVEALASQAAIALTKEHLIRGMKRLFEALTHLIADAIDKKSPYTGGHCRRVPVLTMLLADAVNGVTAGPLKGFSMTERDRYELEIAGWLHDCGKIATPEYVMDKSTKLECVFDRIQMVDTRFEILKRDAEIAWLKQRYLNGKTAEKPSVIPADLTQTFRELDEERDFLRRANAGGEFMSEADQARVRQIGRREWLCDGQQHPLLTDNETLNLSISRGTLNDVERKKINEHIEITIDMLNALPYPRHLRRVPEYAGGHHERMDGKGYPKGLTREQMSVQARIMGIADIFEALTARDRPYKSGKKLSESLSIMIKMKREGHIDPDLFDVFVKEKVYLRYAEKFLDPAQIDAVDAAELECPD
jgi:HD-GYP domain-containing protein (c-di-GMP phosphodiesterase class II)